ncbi:hypothetical protein AMS68_002598 [Peltaster fructicola]|uniref:Uncharacterized protein n=1 Tax=Peltaster fructicola TaxID=286661 RepID=A0A6H0XR00_9PEZI|nr:hypothetical protein AMS68_002598 [Peltaster fructicola]
MAAPRATQWIALRNLSRAGQQVRHLRITPPVERTAKRQRPTQLLKPAVVSETRQFTTSQQHQAARDTSTIDFFYFPDIDHDVDPAAQMMRVPILPDNYNPPRTGAHAAEAEMVVHKPEINAMSLDSVFLPMAELHDGHAMGVDFHAMADRVAANVRNLKAPVEEQASMMKQLWNDMIDDMLSIGKSKKIAA